MSSIFDHVPLSPVDPILGLPIAFAADCSPFKVNLGIGTYKTADGQPFILSAVKKAESILLQKSSNKEYLPIEGDAEFLACASKLLFGQDLLLAQPELFFFAQSVGGTSALRIGGEFLAKLISQTIFIPQPTWANHKQTFERAGLNVGSYPYFDFKTHRFDFDGMCDAIRNMPPKSCILLHACCHNPTGTDPNLEQWKALCDLIKKQQLIPFFDVAYHGFGEDLDTDAQAIRLFIQEQQEMLIAYSFSKNFSLYGERVGFLTCVTTNQTATALVGSQIKNIIRGNYSNPPLHGASIVSTILKSHDLTVEWKLELNSMCMRIKEMRKALVAALSVYVHQCDFSFLLEQKGLFSFLGLDLEQVNFLRAERALYMPINGRINIAGLNTQNISYVAESIAHAISQNK